MNSTLSRMKPATEWFRFTLLDPRDGSPKGGGIVLAVDTRSAAQYAASTVAGLCDVVINNPSTANLTDGHIYRG